MRQSICFFIFLAITGCKLNSQNSLEGNWKLLGPQDVETNVNIEFNKNQYLLHNQNDQTSTTYEYTLQDNKLISKQAGSLKADSMNLNFIHSDSIIVITPNGVYSTLVRQKK